MKTKFVPSAWIEKEGRRLDCGPYLSGAIEAKLLLERLPVRKDPLHKLTLGEQDGIFHAGRESRKWVEDPNFGMPFFSSSEVLLADLSRAPLISRKQVAANPKFVLRTGWTLITRSGTIGRLAYCRPDMDGYACSEHILRVAPDESKIPSGYLYAFLASSYGVPMIIGGTYGSIIQAIEPQHVWELPVPRFGEPLESQCHNLVIGAAKMRCEASQLISSAIKETAKSWGIPDNCVFKSERSPDVVLIASSVLNARLDAFFHGTPATRADSLIEKIASHMPVRTIRECADRVFETPRFGRIPVEDPAFGAPFMSIADLARFDPVSDEYISRRQIAAMNAAVGTGWLILPRVGQLQGLFGHVVCIPPHLDGIAVSDNNIRIVPNSQADSGYIFAALSTELCYWQIVRRACGTSIPYLDSERVRQVPVPWPDETVRKSVAGKVNAAMSLRSNAVFQERKAIGAIEAAVAKGKI